MIIEEMLRHNARFTAEDGARQFATSKYPEKGIAIVTCMDTRLVDLLPAALGIRGGDVKMIKNAGGTITNPFDSTMRSLLVAVYELGVKEIMVIAHTDCGVQGMNPHHMLDAMRARGVDDEHISLMKHCGIDLEAWLHGFDDTEAAVRETVDLIRNHPLMAHDVTVGGYIINTDTGELKPICRAEVSA
jgi:carbonic anhydrase